MDEKALRLAIGIISGRITATNMADWEWNLLGYDTYFERGKPDDSSIMIEAERILFDVLKGE